MLIRIIRIPCCKTYKDHKFATLLNKTLRLSNTSIIETVANQQHMAPNLTIRFKKHNLINKQNIMLITIAPSRLYVT